MQAHFRKIIFLVVNVPQKGCKLKLLIRHHQPGRFKGSDHCFQPMVCQRTSYHTMELHSAVQNFKSLRRNMAYDTLRWRRTTLRLMLGGKGSPEFKEGMKQNLSGSRETCLLRLSILWRLNSQSVLSSCFS